MQLHSPPSADAVLPAPVRGAKRRRQYRQPIKNLAYVNLQPANGAILRNVSQNGIAIQAVAPVQPGQLLQLRFELLNPRVRVEVGARVVWCDRMGQAGLEFLQLPPRMGNALKDWILTQILTAADHSFGAHSMFGQTTSAALDAAPLADFTTVPLDDSSELIATLDLPWFPFQVSPRTLSLVIDCLILFCAVLVFEVISLALTKVFPVGWAGAGLIVLTVISFCGVYWYLFEKVSGATPGKVLVDSASADHQNATKAEDDRPRFR
jgi:hypothetical protein